MIAQKPSVPVHICIVGGGFGGLYTGLYLQKYRHLKGSKITLIEPKEKFLFTPMMYELITDELKEWEIAPTYSSLIAGTNIDWQQTTAEAIDLQKQTVTANGEAIRYDYLVMAQGADSRPVDIPGVDEHTHTFRSLQDALTLKVRLAQLVQVQKLQTEGQPINIVVIGGGPSGVELSSKVSDYLRKHEQTPHTITLVDRGETILKPFEKGLRQLGQKALERRQISILTETSVSAVHSDSVDIDTGAAHKKLPSHLTLWAVGTQPKPWLGQQSVPQNEQGQRVARRSLQLSGHDNVFVIGDSADVRDRHNKPAPNTAQAAFQAASKAAANIAALAKGKQPKPFSYLHLGDMLTLGINDAGLWSFGLTIGGWLAAISRRGVYIFRMPTRRHQIKVARRALKELGRAVVGIFLPRKKRRQRSYEG